MEPVTKQFVGYMLGAKAVITEATWSTCANGFLRKRFVLQDVDTLAQVSEIKDALFLATSLVGMSEFMCVSIH